MTAPTRMKVSRTSTPWSLLLLAVAGFTTVPSSEAAVSVQEILLRAKPAVALVSAEVRAEAAVNCGRGLIPISPTPFVQTGTAWFVDGHGFLVTNAHVIDPAQRLPSWVLNELRKTVVEEGCVGPALRARGLMPGERPDIEDVIRRAVPLGSVVVKPSQHMLVLLSNGASFTPEVVKFSPPLLRDSSGQPLPDSGRDLALLRIPAGAYPPSRWLCATRSLAIRFTSSDSRAWSSATSSWAGARAWIRRRPVARYRDSGRTRSARTWSRRTPRRRTGNSGGPAVNDEASVIGVMTFVSVTTRAQDVQVQGFNFLIPAKDVREFLHDTAVRSGESRFNPVWSAGVAALFQGRYATALGKFREADRLLPGLPDVKRLTAEAEERLRNPPPRPFPWAWTITGSVLFLGIASSAHARHPPVVAQPLSRSVQPGH